MLNRKSVSKWKVLINSVGNKSVRKQLSLYWPVPSAKSASHWTLPARTVVHTDKNSRPHHPESMPRTEQLSSVSVAHLTQIVCRFSRTHYKNTQIATSAGSYRCWWDAAFANSTQPQNNKDNNSLSLLAWLLLSRNRCVFNSQIRGSLNPASQCRHRHRPTLFLPELRVCVCLTGRCHEAVSSLSFPFKPGTYNETSRWTNRQHTTK